MKTLRRRMGLSQKQLAERIGVTQVYISKIEHGEIGGLTINKVIELSHVFKISPEEMFEILLKSKK